MSVVIKAGSHGLDCKQRVRPVNSNGCAFNDLGTSWRGGALPTTLYNIILMRNSSNELKQRSYQITTVTHVPARGLGAKAEATHSIKIIICTSSFRRLLFLLFIFEFSVNFWHSLKRVFASKGKI